MGRVEKKHFKPILKTFFNDNADSVQNPFMLWNAHKAFIRGIFIQLGSRAKRQRQKCLDELTKEILIIVTQNKLKTNRSQKLS